MRRMLGAVIAAAITLAACGGSSTNTGGGGGGSSSCETSKLNLVTPGTLTVATGNPAYPPYFQGGTKSSEWKLNDPNNGKGFESAVAYEVAKRLGFSPSKVTWIATTFPQSYAPGPKNWDFNIQQIAYNAKRAAAVDFSEAYYRESEALVAVKGTPITHATTISDLKPYTLAAPIGTTSYDFITNVIQPTKEPGSYQSQADAVAAINAGAVDGLVVDYPTALYMADPFVQQVKNSVVVGQFPTGANAPYWGMTFDKGNPLLHCVNQALDDMKRDGTLEDIATEWLSQKTNVGHVPIFQAS